MEEKNKCKCGKLKLVKSKVCSKCHHSKTNKSTKPSNWGKYKPGDDKLK